MLCYALCSAMCHVCCMLCASCAVTLTATHGTPISSPSFLSLSPAGIQNVVVITGAGISVPCGIPDFRSENGLYSVSSHVSARKGFCCGLIPPTYYWMLFLVVSCSLRCMSLLYSNAQRLGEYNLPNPQCMFDKKFFSQNPKPFYHFAR